MSSLPSASAHAAASRGRSARHAAPDAAAIGWGATTPVGVGFQLPFGLDRRLDLDLGYTYTLRDDINRAILEKGNDGYWSLTVGLVFCSDHAPAPPSAESAETSIPTSTVLTAVKTDRDRDGLLQVAIASDHVEMVRLLLDLGLDPDDRHQLLQYESRPYSWGEPLAWAAGNGQYACAELLLERGADPNASIYASGNPVSAAYNNADERMKGLLFRHGGILDPITAGLEGETSAAAVALHNDPSLAAELLWAAGCGGEPNIVGMCLRQLDWSPQDERWFNLLEQPLRLWRTNPHRKFRDFDRAVYPEIFRMILERGVDPNLAGRFGYRLAHRLAACGVVWNEPIMSEAERVAFATILLEHGADLNVVDELLQSSPLGWAARWGRYDLARLYLEQGADPILAGEEWATPLAWAEKKSNTDIADLIMRYL